MPLIARMTSPLRRWCDPKSRPDNFVTTTPPEAFFKVTPTWGKASLVTMMIERRIGNDGIFVTMARHIGQRKPEHTSDGSVHSLQVITCSHGSSLMLASLFMHTMHSISLVLSRIILCATPINFFSQFFFTRAKHSIYCGDDEHFMIVAEVSIRISKPSCRMLHRRRRATHHPPVSTVCPADAFDFSWSKEGEWNRHKVSLGSSTWIPRAMLARKVILVPRETKDTEET